MLFIYFFYLAATQILPDRTIKLKLKVPPQHLPSHIYWRPPGDTDFPSPVFSTHNNLRDSDSVSVTVKFADTSNSSAHFILPIIFAWYMAPMITKIMMVYFE